MFSIRIVAVRSRRCRENLATESITAKFISPHLRRTEISDHAERHETDIPDVFSHLPAAEFCPSTSELIRSLDASFSMRMLSTVVLKVQASSKSNG